MPRAYCYTDSQLEKLSKIKKWHEIIRNIDPQYQKVYGFYEGWREQSNCQATLKKDMLEFLSEFEAPLSIRFLAEHAGTRDGGFYRALKWIEDAIDTPSNTATKGALPIGNILEIWKEWTECDAKDFVEAIHEQGKTGISTAELRKTLNDLNQLGRI